jgi:hypothetical protein
LTLSPRVALIFFGFGLITIFFTPIIYYSYSVTSVEHIKLFTWLMRYGGSLAALPLSLALLHGLWHAGKATGSGQPLRAALIASMVLFGAGGAIGFLISGTNVTIPAHYHGNIVGVTLAFMGLTYHLLPQLGFRAPEVNPARLQPWLYGGGQLLHVLPGDLGWLRRAAQGRGRGAGARQRRPRHRHWSHGSGRPDLHRRRISFIYICYRAVAPGTRVLSRNA